MRAGESAERARSPRWARVCAFIAAACVAVVLAPQALAATFTVNSAADTDGTTCAATCTLRQAINAANALPDADTIVFAAAQGPYVIQPATALPQITQPLTIDGSATNVQVDGTATTALYGLDFEAPSFPVSGVIKLSVTGWNRGNGAGIKVGSGAAITVTGSDIGTDWSESSATIGNYSGIEVDGSATVSGSDIFSANTTGLAIFGTAAVSSAYFGPAGGAHGNSSQAILVQSSSPAIQINTANQIGGNGAGIRLLAPSSGVQILSNNIGALGNGASLNTGGGIIYGFDNGHTANDAGDGDTGPNGLQNSPLLTAAYTNGGSQVTIAGTLNSTPSTQFTVQVFVSPSCDPSGFGQGSAYAGALSSVTTDGSGNATISGTIANGSGFATATVTGPSGTSEFSNCVQITNSPPQTFTVNTVATTTHRVVHADDCSLREAILAAKHTPARTRSTSTSRARGVPTIVVANDHRDG